MVDAKASAAVRFVQLSPFDVSRQREDPHKERWSTRRLHNFKGHAASTMSRGREIATLGAYSPDTGLRRLAADGLRVHASHSCDLMGCASKRLSSKFVTEIWGCRWRVSTPGDDGRELSGSTVPRISTRAHRNPDREV